MDQIVLDLDMDFFVCPTAYSEDVGNGRLPPHKYSVWNSQEATDFMERQCRLKITSPVTAQVVEGHDGAFCVWKRWIDCNLLKTPFHVVHIDAHADIGMGWGKEGGWEYLMTDIMFRPLLERRNPKKGKYQLNEGNFLLFACACEWIASITFVHLHRIKPNDLMSMHFKNCDVDSGILQLKAIEKEQLGDGSCNQIRRVKPTHLGPEIPFRCVRNEDFCFKHRFDSATIAKSPQYTPKSADGLLHTLLPYFATGEQ